MNNICSEDGNLIISPAAQMALMQRNFNDLDLTQLESGATFVGTTETSYREKYMEPIRAAFDEAEKEE